MSYLNMIEVRELDSDLDFKARMFGRYESSHTLSGDINDEIEKLYKNFSAMINYNKDIYSAIDQGYRQRRQK